MLLKLALLITSLTSIGAISINKIEIENINTSNTLFSLINTEKMNNLLNKYKFYLTLSDEGELFVEDQYHNLYQSNWNKRLYSNHIRFVNSILYDITSCNEHVRNKYINYIFAKPEYYEYYLIPNDPTNLVKNTILIIY